jgi:anti-sigma regulatory factor (Ser/Thr protein kinase)
MYKSQVKESENIIDIAFDSYYNQFEVPSQRFGFPEPPPGSFYIVQGQNNNELQEDTVYFRVNFDYKIFTTSVQFKTFLKESEFFQDTIYEIFDVKNPPQRGVVDVENTSFRYRYCKIGGGKTGYYAVILLNRAPEISYAERLVEALIYISGGMFLFMFLVNFFISKWLVKPTAVAYKKQQQFVSDASHELKTPLTVIATNVDAILSNPTDTIEEQRKWLIYIKNEAIRMSTLTNNLLKLTRENQTKPVNVKFDLSEVLEDICINFEVFAFEKNRTLKTEIQKNIQLNGDESSIRQLVTILLDNAVKYSTEYAIIEVILRREKKTKIIVSNTGSEIPQQDIAHIFDRFYRSDSSRTKTTGGFGLGLSIAKKITDEHKANISCKSANNKTEFTVEF